jgi:cell division septal protein FtsQ
MACLGFLAAAVAGEFRVRHVDVIGVGVASDEVIQASDVVGENIFTLRSDQVVSRLAALPDIEVLRVDTSFPSSVKIYVHRRLAVAAWNENGQLFAVDARGVVLSRLKSTRLPLVTGASPNGHLDPGTVAAVIYAWQTLPAQPNGALSTIRYDPLTGLTLVARGEWTASVGKGTPLRLVSRVATLASFLHNSQVRGKVLRYVDLRYRPAYARFAGP